MRWRAPGQEWRGVNHGEDEIQNQKGENMAFRVETNESAFLYHIGNREGELYNLLYIREFRGGKE